MLALMMMDVGCWDAELLSWEALAASSRHTFPQMSHCVCDRVFVIVAQQNGEKPEMNKPHTQKSAEPLQDFKKLHVQRSFRKEIPTQTKVSLQRSKEI